MGNHKIFEDSLIEFALGHLKSQDAVDLLQHVENCDICKKKLGRLRNLLNVTFTLKNTVVSEELYSAARTSLGSEIKSPPLIFEVKRYCSLIYHNEIVRAVAAVILFASALYAWTGHIEQFIVAQAVSSERIVIPIGQMGPLEWELQRAHRLFNMGEKEELEKMLQDSEYPYKDTIASYLKELNDKESQESAEADITIFPAESQPTDNNSLVN